MILQSIPKEITVLLNTRGYKMIGTDEVGILFKHDVSPPIFIDVWLEKLTSESYPYTHYTASQNKYMHQYGRLLRFDSRNIETLESDIDWFVGDQSKDDAKLFGADRRYEHIDPTPPEWNFAALFEEVFGSKYLHALDSESLYFDRKGHRRFVDYVLNRKHGPVAIELNGECYHHPLLTTQKQYASQLFKQNSLVVDGYQVFRWSDRGMADKVKFSDQIRDFFGCSSEFISVPRYRAQRAVSFTLLGHQEDATKRLRQDRAAGKETSLVVLPTGTGKTEVFIEDFRKLFSERVVQHALVIVPSVHLRDQILKRLILRVPTLDVGTDVSKHSLQVVAQTSAWLVRNYLTLSSDRFDYIVVDEAHRAAAYGLRKVLEHFRPRFLLGLTATHERLDQQKLEGIFGNYEVDMTLEQAIEQGLVPPIRAFRLESSIDLANVRYNGKDFVKSDLNRTVLVPSRDQLIADVLLKYFCDTSDSGINKKQGVVFCVDVKHAKRMAKLLTKHGISALAVSGQDRSGLDDYANGAVRFLCACDLINEGWDAPQTSILVMARPTMSKVLYIQQLGRGTRKHEGKEALYVIDIVDSYGANIQPWSVHALFNLTSYQPFGDLVKIKQSQANRELIVLDQLWEGERRIEPINIFNFEKEYGDLLNDEQLARELFVSTGTVKSWVKKGDVVPTKTLKFGRNILSNFSQESVDEIRSLKGIKQRTDGTRLDDFFEFLEQRDYTFSYKIVFLLSFVSLADDQGEANLSAVCEAYQSFYQHLYDKYGRVEKDNNPYNQPVMLADCKALTKSILKNPFEKYERKRFMHHCNDLNIIAFDSILWARFTQNDLRRVVNQYVEDGKDYYLKLDITLEDSDFNSLGLKRYLSSV